MTRIRLLGAVGVWAVTMTLAVAGTADAQTVQQTAPRATTQAAAPASPAPTGSHASAFMDFEGPAIQGESQDANYKGWIEVSSFSYGTTQTGAGAASGTGTAAGRVNVRDIQITKKLDKSSPLLQQAAVTGKHFQKVVLVLRKAGADANNAVYYRVTMSDVFITRDAVNGGSGGSTTPTESLSLNFTKVLFEYANKNTDGSAGQFQNVQDSWDVKTNVRM